MTFVNPEDGWDMIVNLLVFGAIVIPAWFGYRKLKRGVDETNNQVRNGHPTPLRVDLDKRFDDLTDMISGLHEDLREERQERRDGVKALRVDMDHRFGEIKNRLH